MGSSCDQAHICSHPVPGPVEWQPERDYIVDSYNGWRARNQRACEIGHVEQVGPGFVSRCRACKLLPYQFFDVLVAPREGGYGFHLVGELVERVALLLYRLWSQQHIFVALVR